MGSNFVFLEGQGGKGLIGGSWTPQGHWSEIHNRQFSSISGKNNGQNQKHRHMSPV